MMHCVAIFIFPFSSYYWYDALSGENRPLVTYQPVRVPRLQENYASFLEEYMEYILT